MIPVQPTVSVDAEDIAVGVPRDPEHCPIAHAIRRQLPIFDHVEVDGGFVRVSGTTGPDTWFRASYTVDEPVIAFQEEFDALGITRHDVDSLIKPFRFDMMLNDTTDYSLLDES